MARDPFMEISTENNEHNASEKWDWQWSRCWICLQYNDLVRHTDVQLLLEAWGMSSYAGKHCIQQPSQSFPTISLFSVPLSLDTVYLNHCPWFCMCPLFTLFWDQASSFTSTCLTLHTPALMASPLRFVLNVPTALHLNDLCNTTTLEKEDGTMYIIKCWMALQCS